MQGGVFVEAGEDEEVLLKAAEWGVCEDEGLG